MYMLLQLYDKQMGNKYLLIYFALNTENLNFNVILIFHCIMCKPSLWQRTELTQYFHRMNFNKVRRKRKHLQGKMFDFAVTIIILHIQQFSGSLNNEEVKPMSTERKI